MEMKNKLHLILLILITSLTNSYAQKDNYYLEDQIFISGTYNLLMNKHDSIKQGGFSNGFEIGYIRDIPLNERRNFGLGVGISYSSVNYYQNIAITTLENGSTDFQRLNNEDFIRNKFHVSYIEIPFEIRYRTSTIDVYSYFRAYLGFKIGYKLTSHSKLKTNEYEVAYFNQPEFSDLRYGLTLSLGYGTWNFRMYYNLNKVFVGDTEANSVISGNPTISMDMNELAIGLIFYLI